MQVCQRWLCHLDLRQWQFILPAPLELLKIAFYLVWGKMSYRYMQVECLMTSSAYARLLFFQFAPALRRYPQLSFLLNPPGTLVIPLVAYLNLNLFPKLNFFFSFILLTHFVYFHIIIYKIYLQKSSLFFNYFQKILVHNYYLNLE
jgi:hypothetical protein